MGGKIFEILMFILSLNLLNKSAGYRFLGVLVKEYTPI